jgi:hypothetical protein
MYREWKEIELCWFGNVQRMKGNRIVLVWGCTGNGSKLKCVGVGMYREWKDIELCWFGDVQRMEGNRIVLFRGCTENGRNQNSQSSIVYECGINKTKR